MIDHENKLPISRQAKVLGISRGTVYYQPRPVSPWDQALMNRIDRLHLELPFAGARMLRDLLGQEGHKVGRTPVATLMKRMGIEALYRKPRTTKPQAGHQVYPYLLRDGHYLSADDQGLCVTGCCRGLVFPSGPVLEGIHHHGCALLPRGG